MPEVRVAMPAQQFDPAHAEAEVRALNNIGFLELRMKTGPATSCVELAAGVEQGMTAADAMILPRVPALFVNPAEWRLGAGLPRDPVLLRIELLFPLLVSFVYFCHASIVTKPGPGAYSMLKIYAKSVTRIAAMGLCIIMLTAGCAGPSYYGQAVSGHMRLMNQREDVRLMLDSETTDPDLARDLELTIRIREFAVKQLDLPDNDSYSQFVRTGQEAVTWNVIAAPEFSLAPKQWCFLGPGCVPYRGYFKQEEAIQFAGSMASKGYDTTVSPAIAYSTLGWFDDPLLDTMFQYSDEQLAAFIFHELAHQKLYVKGDTAFNEAYAGFIEQTGLTRWLEQQGRAGEIPDRQKASKAALQLNQLLQSTREQLTEIYGSDKPEAVMRKAKSDSFTRLVLDYQAMVESQWEGRNYYENLFAGELNNASLALINTYQGGRCAFKSLYQQAGRNMARFHELSAVKAKLAGDARAAWLNRPCEAIASNSDL